MKNKNGQSAIEYLLLLGVVVAIVLVAFYSDLGQISDAGGQYFNRAVEGIVGEAPHCGDGTCDDFETEGRCCVDCGGNFSCQ